jgi:hypothetical protein
MASQQWWRWRRSSGGDGVAAVVAMASQQWWRWPDIPDSNTSLDVITAAVFPYA